jgi:hypothetical protein
MEAGDEPYSGRINTSLMLKGEATFMSCGPGNIPE